VVVSVTAERKSPATSDRAISTTATTQVDTAELTAQLINCEKIIERGLQTFVEVGNALLTIRDQRLYRQDHASFEGYCRDRWGFTSSRARQLIGASQSVTNVTLAGGQVPTTESQARQLAGLTAQQAAIVMRVAHENSGGKITAAAIRAARAQPWTNAEITTAIDGYRIHPFLACFPEFTPDEWQGLSTSVGRWLLAPIILSPDGRTILDGRFRYLALRWNGIDPATATTHQGNPAFKQLGQHYNTETMILDVICDLNCLRKSYTADEVAAAEKALAAAKRGADEC
jgi:hypothetical protein